MSSEVRVDGERVRELRETYRRFREKLREAEEIAESLGRVIGHVSRDSPSRISMEDSTVTFSIDPGVYLDNWSRLGRAASYVGVVDIKGGELVVMRLVEIIRTDAIMAFEQRCPLPTTPPIEPGGLLTPVTIKAKPLVRVDGRAMREALPGGRPAVEPKVADIVIEPQSPVILPNAEVLEAALGLNVGEVVVGALSVGDEPVVVDGRAVRVTMRVSDLFQHVLVCGTTGAGKTSFIKNVISQMLSIDAPPLIVVIDATGDYYHMFIPPASRDSLADLVYGEASEPSSVTILYPVTSDFAEEVVKRWSRPITLSEALMGIAFTYFERYVKPICDALGLKAEPKRPEDIAIDEKARSVRITLTFERRGERLGRKTLEIVPFALVYKDVREEVKTLNPYFTEQAALMLDTVVSAVSEGRDVKSLRELVRRLVGEGAREVQSRTHVHRSTLENIFRGLLMLNNMGIFDVRVGRVLLTEVDYPKLLSDQGRRLVILDLYNISGGRALDKVLTIRLMDKVFRWKEDEVRRGRPRPTIFVIDEAHRFFPKEASDKFERTYIEHVAARISLGARLGRRRKLGFVFSTHRPQDLHSIIPQLCNTKVVFRTTDAEVLRQLGVPKEYLDTITLAQAGTGIVVSHVYRQGHVTIKTPVPPIAGHYDLSRMA
ncbi:hypothetical protein B6U99_00655 [Candidatus Geothermarchaeota archaeon ex4572_27]|nr:MAG: hypothetical protein B6U99_00655 [Candidatus Geothermarchaeota archaeon ex4572_27]